MLDVEVLGDRGLLEYDRGAAGPADRGRVEELCALALASAGIEEGHVAIEFVDAERIHDLNREHRGIDAPTDVLSFAVDEDGTTAGPRELGDIVICPEHTDDLREAVIHGALHLTGMDHETDDGEMLALQARAAVRGEIRSRPAMRSASASSRSPAGPTSASRRWPTPSSARKVAIVSDKPQTTRRAIRGVATGPDWQLVLVDLPGVQRPRDALTERMQRRVERELADADGCLLVLNAEQGVGPGDRFIAALLRPAAESGRCRW